MAWTTGLIGCSPEHDDGYLDTSFLELDPPGTLAAFGAAVLANGVYLLDAAEGISEDRDAGTVTLAAPFRSYQVGDVIVGTCEHTFAYRVTAVSVVGDAATLTVAQASLPEVLPDGALSLRATPDWNALAPTQGSDVGLTVMPDGGLSISNLQLLDLRLAADGAIDWQQSSFLGRPLDPDSPYLAHADTVAMAGGQVTATITQGSILATPTWWFDATLAGGDVADAQGSMDVIALCEFEVEVALSGHAGNGARFRWQYGGDLLDQSYPFLFFAGQVPVRGRFGLAIPVQLELDADAGGTYRFRQRSLVAVHVQMGYTPDDGFHYETTLDSVLEASSDTPGPRLDPSRVAVSLEVAPVAAVRLYGMVAPFLALHSRGQLTLEYPWQPMAPEVRSELTCSAGLEADDLFADLDLKADPLALWSLQRDLWQPDSW